MWLVDHLSLWLISARQLFSHLGFCHANLQGCTIFLSPDIFITGTDAYMRIESAQPQPSGGVSLLFWRDILAHQEVLEVRVIDFSLLGDFCSTAEHHFQSQRMNRHPDVYIHLKKGEKISLHLSKREDGSVELVYWSSGRLFKQCIPRDFKTECQGGAPSFVLTQVTLVNFCRNVTSPGW